MKLLRKFRRDESPLHTPSAIAHGITHGSGGVWAWVEIPPRSTDEQDGDTLEALTLEASAGLTKIIPPGAEFHAKILWRTTTGDEYLADQLTDDLTEGQRDYLEMGAVRIDQLAFPQRIVLLGVRLDRQAPGFESTTAKVRRVTGTSTAKGDAESALDGPTMRRVWEFHSAAARSSFQARPASAQLLAWTLRRDLHRIVEQIPDGSLIAGGQVARLKATHVVPAMDHLEIHTQDGVKFLRLVTTAENGFPPDSLQCPGGEWLKQLDVTGSEYDPASPVEVSIRGRNVPAHEAGNRIKDALVLTKEQARSASQGTAEEAPGHVERARVALLERQDSGVPMVADGVTWVVEADDLETLDRRTGALIDYYSTPRLGITLWAPPADQDLLWKQLVIGDTRRVAEFDNFRPMTTLAGAWFHGGSAAGAEHGLFLAQNVGSTPGPYVDRLSDAQLEGGAITTLFLGTTGAGKTTAAALALLGEAVMGAWTLMTDFKGDMGGICAAAELFGVPVTRVSTAELSSGVMDPFRYVVDPQEAKSIAIDALSFMLSAVEDLDALGHITRAADRVVKLASLRRSTHRIIVELLDDETAGAADLGERLQRMSMDPLARPVAGVPDFSAPQLPTRAGLVYLAFEGLRWPGEDLPLQQWRQGERLTMGLVQAAFQYVTYQAGRVKGIPKVVALTELHQLTRYPAGRSLVGDLARRGRALDVNLLLDTQAVVELLKVEGLVDQVSAVHAFRVKTNAEADAQAELLGLQPGTPLRRTQKSHAQGRCLTRDRAGRVAPILFDYLASEIQTALSTKPKRDQPTPLPVPAAAAEIDPEDTDDEEIA
ncbi:MAG TPA: ATP-binding protein [Mycobacterium sp.]